MPARVKARFVAIVVFPVPPFPLAMAIFKVLYSFLTQINWKFEIRNTKCETNPNF
jgi:hypothetical protein